MSTPLTARGTRTKTKLIEAAETVFARYGYTDASVVRITEEAGVGQGTFYLYFSSKLEIFEELVEDLNRRVRRAMSEASGAASTRIESERAGFRAFFEFTAEHPALYRVVREAEFVSPKSLRLHYSRIVDGYIEGLKEAQLLGEIGDIDPTVAAWALMGIGEMIGMRWVLWGDSADAGHDADPTASGTSRVPDEVLDQMITFIRRALAVPEPRNEGVEK
ncbi:TetR/AcrR family transcriptional regulator [Salinibacterium sp. M195]|uniref:TetR/AcrR family transcriptional regulator n=1 Tax=Salinibacterium sp. M195 TaxID=2583374 RepID=UPI001C628CD1|nr:TetR/AcrR family transcriptional regulator [Salinibacterium sp. M195]QYH36522.1 TetR/AcrR family transcriptional regulator [Salinibacterium sp. M195]